MHVYSHQTLENQRIGNNRKTYRSVTCAGALGMLTLRPARLCKVLLRDSHIPQRLPVTAALQRAASAHVSEKEVVQHSVYRPSSEYTELTLARALEASSLRLHPMQWPVEGSSQALALR